MAASNKAVGTWNTAADWTPSGVPSDIVTITTTGTNTLYTLSGAASNTITGLNISAPSLKFATLVFATNATLNVSGNVAFAQTGTSAALAASLRGQGTLNVTGSISGSGTLASTSAVTLKIVANSLNSTGLVASASATSAVVDLNLTNTSTLASISVSNTAMVRLSSGSLTVASVVGGNLNTGTIAAFGGALTITNVLTTGTAAAQTLLASGGTITVNGGSMGGGGLTFADVAGSRFNVGGALTSGSINFAGTGN
ncbi:MAG: hypothetical protein H7232_12240, partial [Aeromicrobium sp.]|nr:hypothetical protein [Burkholderiales bacterium]